MEKFYAKLVIDKIYFIFLETLKISQNFITILYTSYNFRNKYLLKLLIRMEHFQFFFTIIGNKKKMLFSQKNLKLNKNFS